MGVGELLEKPNKLRGSDLRWTSLPSRGSRNTPSRFRLKKPGSAPVAMSQSAPKLHLSQFGFLSFTSWLSEILDFIFSAFLEAILELFWNLRLRRLLNKTWRIHDGGDF